MSRRNRGSRWTAAALLAALAGALTAPACWFSRGAHARTSLVDYLYPDRKEPVAQERTPVLSLPLRVGVAFVPGNGWYGSPSALSEVRQQELLREVAAHFEKEPFVDRIDTIPSAYLRHGGGFANLDQVRRIHGIDVIALVSYDQTQFNEQGFASVSYWTIVGAYVVPGEINDTHTMIDTAVYDIPSRTFLFRAPGVHHSKGRSTRAALTRELRRDSEEGFEKAARDMIVQLDAELERFKRRLKDRPDEVRVVERPGFEGVGAAGPALLALIAALAVARLAPFRSRPPTA